jgi:LPXTG-motif cell wall-anchored protein
MKTSTVVLIIAGVAALGGGFYFLSRKSMSPLQKGVAPPLNTSTGAANTPSQQIANLGGQIGGILATAGLKKLESFFN